MSCRSFDISALLSFVRFLNSLISCSLLEIFLGFFCTSAYSFSYSFLANIFDYCLFTNEALYRMRTHNSHTLVQHNSRDLYSLLMVNRTMTVPYQLSSRELVDQCSSSHNLNWLTSSSSHDLNWLTIAKYSQGKNDDIKIILF